MPDRIYFTENDDANKLLAADPFALLVGFALDQQVTVQQAFQGPLRLKQRIGTLDPKTLARTDLEPAFREKPAIHRFPGNMARRVQDLAAFVAEEYNGDASRIWTDAKDGGDLKKRIGALPGFGDMKIRSLTAVLAKRFDVDIAKEVAPNHPTLGDVDSAQALTDYQAAKREYKASLRSKSAR
ncbi:MAG TPA: HhH-GPD-type base excision DNA repair protein [Gaiellaceae bacterium]|nr:HhH-GPD-type base excision DNA repair protein [Gaiellaceae bacterium]